MSTSTDPVIVSDETETFAPASRFRPPPPPPAPVTISAPPSALFVDVDEPEATKAFGPEIQRP
ncbi:MAG TPA: hypothetical protein VEH77_11765, partial [Roseiarcus sp.]|nr:hypothetical protein [Roseiarcus sp.]